MTIHPDSAEWVAVLRYDVIGGALDAIRLRMPAAWAAERRAPSVGQRISVDEGDDAARSPSGRSRRHGRSGAPSGLCFERPVPWTPIAKSITRKSLRWDKEPSMPIWASSMRPADRWPIENVVGSAADTVGDEVSGRRVRHACRDGRRAHFG